MNEVKVWLESEEEEVRLLSVLLGSISYFNKKRSGAPFLFLGF